MRSDRSWLRDNAAAVVVVILAAAITFLTLFVVGSGVFLSMLLSLAVLFALGAFHYLVWGRSMRRQTIEGRRDDRLT
jgi:hypothetical protein